MIEQAEQSRRGVPRVLSSNGVEIITESFAPMRDSTPWRHQPEQLRTRFAEDGYVLIRGLLDRRQIFDLRAAYFACFDATFLAPGSTAEEGVFSGTVPESLPEYGTAGHPA